MNETYSEQAEDAMMTKSQAMLELAKHGMSHKDFNEFFKYLGIREEYDAQEVLEWLGY